MILLLGSEGQLGTSLRKKIKAEVIALNSKEADVTRIESLEPYFKNPLIKLVINCAAYTAVDKAEDQRDLCFAVNSKGPYNIAKLCEQYQKKLIHISTDYVFSGESNSPLKEDAMVNPQNVYGKSKLEGENNILNSRCEFIIIRTSWLYSRDHSSFLKTMLSLGQSKKEINVVNDQIGSPTWVEDLASFIVLLCNKMNVMSYREIFHYSNEGQCSWFEFASEIMKIKKFSCIVHPIASSEYPTKAQRPNFSLLSKDKVIKTFGIKIPDWRSSLKEALKDE